MAYLISPVSPIPGIFQDNVITIVNNFITFITVIEIIAMRMKTFILKKSRDRIIGKVKEAY